MNDGWDDDDDLDLTLDDNNDDDDDADKNDEIEATTSTFATKDRGGGGWEADEELFGEDEDDKDDDNVKVVGVPVGKTKEDAYGGGGWDEDVHDEDLNFDDDNWGEDIGTHQAFSIPAAPPLQAPRPISAASQQNNAFGAGFQIPVGNNEALNSTKNNAATATATIATAGGWEEDEELFSSADDDGEVQVENAPSPVPPPRNNLLQELEDYVGALSRIQSSINAVLDFEYNTPEKAQELLDYYAARPGLAEYTRTKEVPRMNYQVILPNGHVETDKQLIAQHHLPDHSMIARCANQSLLADLLQVLTGPDLVVRQQFLAICVAQTCQFRLHFGDEGRDMLQCNCMLQLSLPVKEGPRLQIATLRTTVAFSPHQQMVKFHIDKIVVTLKESQYFKLEKVADFLTMMEGHLMELPGHEDLALQNAPADIFRDAFLEQSQQLLTQSKAGMKSALNEMESVIGLKSKFKAVRGGISKFLPDTNVLLAAEEEARAFAAEREARPQKSVLAAPIVAQRAPPHPPSQPPPTHSRPPPARPVPAPSSDSSASRPKSILGGLVSTGWSALAKHVTIPDEDDPAIYGGGPSSLAPPRQQAMLYRKQELTPPPPQAHRRPESSSTSMPLSEPIPPNGSRPPQGPSRPIPSPPAPGSVQQYEKPRPPSMLVPPPPRGLPQSGKETEAPSISNVAQSSMPPTQERPPVSKQLELGADETSKEGTNPTLALDDDIIADEGFGDGWDDDLDITTHDDVVMDHDDVKEEQSELKGVATTSTDGGEEFSEELPESEAPNTEGIAEKKTTIAKAPPPPPPPRIQPSSMTALQVKNSAVPLKPSAPPPPAPKVKQPARPRRSLLADIPYDADDDIIPTRKRWVNPRPDRSYTYQ